MPRYTVKNARRHRIACMHHKCEAIRHHLQLPYCQTLPATEYSLCHRSHIIRQNACCSRRKSCGAVDVRQMYVASTATYWRIIANTFYSQDGRIDGHQYAMKPIIIRVRGLTMYFSGRHHHGICFRYEIVATPTIFSTNFTQVLSISCDTVLDQTVLCEH